MTRHSCWQRSAALRVAPSAQQQSELGTDGHTAGHRLPLGRSAPAPWGHLLQTEVAHLAQKTNSRSETQGLIIQLKSLKICGFSLYL